MNSAAASGDASFKVEWVPGLKMIADPFSRMVLLPTGRKAMSLAEICFGDEFGKRIFAEKSGGKAQALSTLVLFYTPVTFMRLCDEAVLDVELEGGISSERLIRHCMVPVTREHKRPTTDKHLTENGNDRENVFDISTAYMVKVDLLQSGEIIARHIAACRQCQQFAKPNPLAVPGYSVSPTDVFSHWSIDFAGPFPEDVTTGAKYAILAVDWLSRWAEVEPTSQIEIGNT